MVVGVPSNAARFRQLVEAADSYVGKRVRKQFGEEAYDGKVTSYAWNKANVAPNQLPDNAVLFRVRYSDGDTEDMNEGELQGVLA